MTYPRCSVLGLHVVPRYSEEDRILTNTCLHSDIYLALSDWG